MTPWALISSRSLAHHGPRNYGMSCSFSRRGPWQRIRLSNGSACVLLSPGQPCKTSFAGPGREVASFVDAEASLTTSSFADAYFLVSTSRGRLEDAAAP